jgi:hypothetical protein
VEEIAFRGWDVVVVKHMALSQEAIERFEETLQEVASSLNGRNDGWGCFSEPCFSANKHAVAAREG